LNENNVEWILVTSQLVLQSSDIDQLWQAFSEVLDQLQLATVISCGTCCSLLWGEAKDGFEQLARIENLGGDLSIDVLAVCNWRVDIFHLCCNLIIEVLWSKQLSWICMLCVLLISWVNV